MSLDKIKKDIVESIRGVRKERRFTQKELADLLGITQARYSQIENGNGSFTAEQLVILMQKFNIALDLLVQEKKSGVSHLQNALSRFGAGELYEEPDLLPSERLAEVSRVVIETIVSAESSRQIASLAPVIVKNISYINFNAIRMSLQDIGLSGRLGWLLENCSSAIAQITKGVVSRQNGALYGRALVKIDPVVGLIWSHWSALEDNLPEDVLDGAIASQRTLDEVKGSRDPLAKKWKIATRITTDDFVKALKEAGLD